MTTRFGACAVFLVAAQLTACGGNDDGDGNNTQPDASVAVDAGVTPDAGPSAAAEALCNTTDGIYIEFFSRFFECNPFFELFLNATPDADDFREVCLKSLEPFLDDGSITVPSDLSACTDYVANTSCELFDADVNPCTSILVGTIAAGGDCDTDDQCMGDNYCMDGATAADCGSCTAVLADGAACTDSAECAAGYCKNDDTCGAKSEIGGACTGSDDCLGSLVCDGGTSLCIAPPAFAVDDACDGEEPFDGCGFPVSGLYCGPDTDLCREELDVGDTCDNLNFCALAKYEWCDNGTCAAPGTANDGEACNIAINTQANKCASGLLCTNPFGNGGGTCYQPQQEGEACDEEGTALEQCALFLECIDSVCAYNEYSGECPAP